MLSMFVIWLPLTSKLSSNGRCPRTAGMIGKKFPVRDNVFTLFNSENVKGRKDIEPLPIAMEVNDAIAAICSGGITQRKLEIDEKHVWFVD